MPFRVVPTFQPARVQPIESFNPQQISESFFDPIAKAQAIKSQQILDQIRTQLAPYQTERARLQNEALQNELANAPLENAIKQIAARQAGIFTSPQIAGQPATVPAIPLNATDAASVMKSDLPSFGPNFVGPKPADTLAPDVTGPSGVVPPVVLGPGRVYDQATAIDQAARLFGTKLAQDKLLKQQESDIEQGRQIAVEEAKIRAEKSKGKQVLLKNKETGEIMNVTVPTDQPYTPPEGFEQEKTTEQNLRDALAIEKAFDQKDEVKKFKEVSSNFRNVQQAVAAAKTDPDLMAADNVLLDQFLKMANPKAVVRVGAVNTALKAQSLIDKLKSKYASLLEGKGGFLSPADRKAMLDMGQKLYQNDLQDYNAVRSHFIKKYRLGETDLPLIEDASITNTPQAFNSVADVEAANPPDGTPVVVNGRKGIYRRK